MKRRLVVMTEIISPYRIPLLNALAACGRVKLHVIFLAETDPSLRQWQVYKDEIRFSYEVLPSWRKRLGRYNILLNRRVGQTLTVSAPDVILCGGYSYIASWQALNWARSRNVPILLWSESNQQDWRHGFALVEALKNLFLEKCSGFVVPGRTAREYLLIHRVNEKLIFTAPNAVDNAFFASAARRARQATDHLRRQLDLPERYFLFVGRLVREKGVYDLLSAYAKLDEFTRREYGLVFVGDGVVRHDLEAQSATIAPGMVKFAGFAQRERLAEYYALAEALILPTYTDTWGLVVNEAMACGLPVILSRAAGAAADLVEENWNGLLVAPHDVNSLAEAIAFLAHQPELCRTMGARSSERVARYSPEEWAISIVNAIETVGSNCD